MSNKNKMKSEENDEEIMKCQVNDWDSNADCTNESDERYVLRYIPVSMQSKARSTGAYGNYIEAVNICETCYDLINNGTYGYSTDDYCELAKSIDAVMVVDLDAGKESD